MLQKFVIVFIMSLFSFCSYSQKFILHEKEFVSVSDDKSISEDTVGLNYDIKYNRFFFDVDPAIDFINGDVITYFVAKENGFVGMDFQLSDSLVVDSVVFHHRNMNYSQNNDILSIVFDETVPNESLDSIKISYHGNPPDDYAFATGEHDGVPVLWTLSEPYSAKMWWPCKNALSDKIDSLDVWIKNPEQYKAASNGMLISERVLNTYRLTHWKHKYPIAAYLFAIAVSDYEIYDYHIYLNENDSLEVLNYVYPEDYDLAVQRIPKFDKSVKLYDQLFMPYPFSDERYGHVQMSKGGGMEHQTMTFIGSFDFHLLSHEVAHQWFGDYVTLSNWHDIWLNEGFATYLTGLAYEFAFDTHQWWDIWRPEVIGHITSEPDGSVYVPDISERDRIFDARLSYSKAAYLLHMLRWVLGDDAFFEAIQNYLGDPEVAYGYAKQEDLVYHLEMAGDTCLTEFFEDWYYGEGYPSYEAVCNQINEEDVIVTLYQSQSDESVDFFEMPVPIQFKNDEHDTVLVLDHSFSGQEFLCEIGFVPDSVIIDHDYHLISANNTVLLSVQEMDETDSVFVFPNPANDWVNIFLPEENASLSIFSLSGKRIYQNNYPEKGRVRVNVSNWEDGVYILKIQGEKHSYLERLILSKI